MPASGNQRRARRARPLAAKLVSAGLAGLLLAACSQQPLDERSALKQSGSFLQVTTQTPEPAEFVRQSRPGETLDFIPVGVTPPSRAIRPRAASDVQALESELDRERKASQDFARRPKPRSTYDGSKPPRVAPPPKELLPQ